MPNAYSPRCTPARGLIPALILSCLGVTATLVLFGVTAARAQITSIGLYSDPQGGSCSFSGNATGVFSAYVVFRPDIEGVRGVEFAAPVPSCLGASFLNDVVPAGALAVGSSQSGLSIALLYCYGEPVSVLEISFYRYAPTTPCCEYRVVADPTTGTLGATDCSYRFVSPTIVVSHFNADGTCNCEGNSAPSPPSGEVPMNNATGQPVAPLMSWAATDADGNIAAYDLYLGDTTVPPLAVAGLTVAHYTPAPLEPLTQYYWRVVVRDAAGLETPGPVWTFTTGLSNNPPYPPAFPFPVSGSLELLPAVNLQWLGTDPEGDSLAFDLHLGTAPDPPRIESGLTSPNYSASLEFGTTYYWRVIAREVFGGGEASGPQWTFSTRPANYPPDAPGAPVPPNGADQQPVNVVLRWSASDRDGDALVFDVYLGVVPNPPLVASNVAATTFSPPTLLLETQYWWRVVARDTRGAETTSATWFFNTRPVNIPPAAPSSPSPATGSTNRLVTSSLSWQCSDADGHAITYDVYFGTATTPPLVAGDVPTKSFNPGLLSFGTIYRWRIVARDALGAQTSGATWNFTTSSNNPPNVPSNPSPPNGSTNRSVNTTLAWQCTDPDGQPLTFDVYFGTSTTPPLVASDVIQPSFAPGGPLALITLYRWRVVARDPLGATRSSATWSFLTEGNHPPSIELLSPIDKGLTGLTPTLYWGGIDINGHSLTYQLYFGVTTSPPLVSIPPASTSYSTGPLQSGTRYYWRVVASDGFTSTNSSMRSFVPSVPGDVTQDGVVTIDDASCALETYLQAGVLPGCGSAVSLAVSDVDCSPGVTPADAVCIHRQVVHGSCLFCVGTSPATVVRRTSTPAVCAIEAMIEGGVLRVVLAVGGVQSLNAFGFRVNSSPKLRLGGLSARGIAVGLEALDSHVRSPGGAAVAGYSVNGVNANELAEFVELQFTIKSAVGDFLVIDEFVDDLTGADPLLVNLRELLGLPLPGAQLVLHQNHPNPFNPQTTIRYELPSSATDARVRLIVLDIAGRMVRTLVAAEQPAGTHEAVWDGRDASGAPVSSGLYFYVLDAGKVRITRKMLVLK